MQCLCSRHQFMHLKHADDGFCTSKHPCVFFWKCKTLDSSNLESYKLPHLICSKAKYCSLWCVKPWPTVNASWFWRLIFSKSFSRNQGLYHGQITHEHCTKEVAGAFLELQSCLCLRHARLQSTSKLFDGSFLLFISSVLPTGWRSLLTCGGSWKYLMFFLFFFSGTFRSSCYVIWRWLLTLYHTQILSVSLSGGFEAATRNYCRGLQRLARADWIFRKI